MAVISLAGSCCGGNNAGSNGGGTVAGKRGLNVLAARDGRIYQVRWQPDELRSLACETLANGDWRRGRVRVIQEAGSHPCDTTFGKE